MTAGLASGLTLWPRAVERPRDAGWTATGTLAGQARARVDQGGLVSPEGVGWSLDWWIGGDDRWYLPAREATVRQSRLGPGPVIETAVRIPGGDARHRVYAVLAGPVPVTVVEVENDSPVPVALVIALRPYGVGVGPGGAAGTSGSGVVGFGGPLSLDGWPSPLGAAHHEPVAVRAGGAVLAVLPRPPAHAGAADDRDLVELVQAGDDPVWGDGVVGPSANAVLLFPLPHRTTLRLLLPAPAPAPSPSGPLNAGGALAAVTGPLRRLLRRPPTVASSSPGPTLATGRPAVGARSDRPGPDGPGEPMLPDPRTVPEAAEVARGWASVLATGARVTVPDSGLGDLADGARCRLLLAADDLGRRLAALAPGAGAELAALALGGHRREVAAAVEPLIDDLAARRSVDPEAAADVLAALGLARSLAWSTPGGDAGPAQPPAQPPASALTDGDRLSRLVAWALAVLAPIDRAGDQAVAARARAGVALLAEPVDPAGAERLLSDFGTEGATGGAPHAQNPRSGDLRMEGATGGAPHAQNPGWWVAAGLVVGPATTLDQLNELAAQASPAGAWGAATGRGQAAGEPTAGDDPAGAARFVAALRSLLVDDTGPDLHLLPGFPSSWRGGALEIHDLPTRYGSLSLAIRWHGYRPALLWQLDPPALSGAGSSPAFPGAVRLRAPGLDAGWSSAEARGEALLTGSGDELPSAPAPGEGFQ